MDTLHFEPPTFHDPRDRRLARDEEVRRLDEVNLSEVDVFMLRGRRLQAQVVGAALRRAFGSLRHLLRGATAAPAPLCSATASATREPQR